MGLTRSGLKCLVFICLIFSGGPSYAQMEFAPLLPQKHIQPNGIQVRITQRGTQYFSTKLASVLGNIGFEVDKGYFPAFTHTSEKAIDMDEVGKGKPDAVRIYKQVLALLTQWLTGFSLSPHLPRIEVGESGYVAEFTRFGLMTDNALLATLGRPRGAVLAIEMEVKKLTAGTQSFAVRDVNNDFLGQLGIQEFTLVAAAAETPLKIRIPFYISLSPEGGIEFEVLDVQENIDTMPISLQYKKLLVPTFTVEMNGRKFSFNTAEVDRLFSNEAPMILNLMKGYIKDFSHEQLPAMLNQKAKEFLQRNLEQVADMSAPGDEAGTPAALTPLKRGMILNTLDQQKGSLIINLDSYIEDPLHVNSTPAKGAGSRGAPNFSLVPAEQYDIGLALDRAVLNRAIQLAFERGNFSKIPVGETTLRLVKSPRFDYFPTPKGVTIKNQETYVKIAVGLELEPGSMFLKDKVVLEFDLIARIHPVGPTGLMVLTFDSVDESSISMDDSYIAWAARLFKGKVQKEVRAEVMKQTAGWKSTPDKADIELPLPPEIMGIKLDINRIVMDPNGHLVLFMEYAKTGDSSL
jgi:hypothetical protein